MNVLEPRFFFLLDDGLYREKVSIAWFYKYKRKHYNTTLINSFFQKGILIPEVFKHDDLREVKLKNLHGMKYFLHVCY